MASRFGSAEQRGDEAYVSRMLDSIGYLGCSDSALRPDNGKSKSSRIGVVGVGQFPVSPSFGRNRNITGSDIESFMIDESGHLGTRR